MSKRYTTEEFIEKAKEIHGNKYNYSKVVYKNSSTKVEIICPKHGSFFQSPYSHLNGCGCPKCGKESMANIIRKDKEQFINEAKAIHGDKYDYSKVEYKNKENDVCIICPKHGEFWQRAANHLKGCGCPKCRYEKMTEEYKDTLQDFIEKANIVHNGKFDYSKVKYIDSQTKVCIICPEHGEFWQKPNNHLHGWGCAKCSGVKQKTTEEFIEEAKKVYGDKYDYSKTIYTTCKKRLIVTCKTHGDFLTLPLAHLRGQECPECSMYRLEKDIKALLEENNIEFIWQYKGEDFKQMRLDFYLPNEKIGIECQGEQHYAPAKFFGGEEKLNAQKTWDKRKATLCKEKGITLLYYTNEKNFKRYSKNIPKNTYYKTDDILKIIKNHVI